MRDLQAATHEQDVTRGRGSTPWVRRVCLGVLVAGWALVLALILGHRIFVSHDTVSNYAHVWYVSERLGHAHPAFTMHTYQHLLPGMSATAAEQFAALIGTSSR